MSTLQPPPVPHLYLLAFDHRHSLEHSLLGLSAPPTADEADMLRHLKSVIYTGFRLALREGAGMEGAGILVDEHYGAHVATHALEEGILLAMSVEKSGQDEFDFEYGEDFGAHLATFEPAFTLARVRYNPEGDAVVNARQVARLARLTDWLRDHARRFLFELRVPATRAQLAAVGDDLERYERELRPSLLVRAMSELQAGGVEPDVWKLEGLERTVDCLRVARQARAGGREQVSCILLARNTGWERLEQWMRMAAPIPGFLGFSIGRTLWGDTIRALHERQLTASEAAERIRDDFQRALILWDKAVLGAEYQRSSWRPEALRLEASPS
ncbi:2-deoxy-5-keto-D-gluconate 6-phosphate aldolase domain-containing protein [Archangium sp.]|uniref:2-deoxy-5-keto-D-gluconate 6-phosphate aldolase domain-containing protein n=1 Tax=Archangium sp. TaxID=1872627 RepID=UPI00389A6305